MATAGDLEPVTMGREDIEEIKEDLERLEERFDRVDSRLDEFEQFLENLDANSDELNRLLSRSQRKRWLIKIAVRGVEMVGIAVTTAYTVTNLI